MASRSMNRPAMQERGTGRRSCRGQLALVQAATCSRHVPADMGSWMHSRHLAAMAAAREVIDSGMAERRPPTIAEWTVLFGLQQGDSDGNGVLNGGVSNRFSRLGALQPPLSRPKGSRSIDYFLARLFEGAEVSVETEVVNHIEGLSVRSVQ